MSSVHNATEHSYVKEQSKGLFLCYFYGAVCPGGATSAAPFLLSGLADQILNGHTLAAVQHHIVRVVLYLGDIQDTDEVVMDHKPLRPVLSGSLGLIYVNPLHKLMQDGGRQRFHLHELPHRFQKLVFAKSAVIVLVTLALQFLNILFELPLFLVIPLGHFHKAVVRQLTRYIVLIGLLSRVNFKKAVHLPLYGQMNCFRIYDKRGFVKNIFTKNCFTSSSPRGTLHQLLF